MTPDLKEYRCSCGKLLCKGRLLFSTVEIRCKRCGKTVLFESSQQPAAPVSFMLAVDGVGTITDTCLGAEALLKYPRDEIIGKPLAAVCPLSHDQEDGKDKHKIKQDIFLARDGNELTVESFQVGVYQNGALAGYRIFGLVARKIADKTCYNRGENHERRTDNAIHAARSHQLPRWTRAPLHTGSTRPAR